MADIIGQVFSEPVAALVTRHERATTDYLEYRRSLEAMTAELAAARATEADRDLLTRILKDMQAAHASGSFEEEMAADLELHNAIGEAAHNIILLHTVRSCYRLLSEGIFAHRKLIYAVPGARDRLLEQHAALVEAILAGDPARAREAAQHHIDFVIETSAEAARGDERNRVSRLRVLQRLERESRQGKEGKKVHDV